MVKTALPALLLALGAALPASAQVRESRRLEACRDVLLEVLGMPESMPRDLLDQAECVAVVPSVKKLALGVGGRFGKGAVVCRTPEGARSWGAPLMLHLGGPSIGFQIGGQAADYVFLIMNAKGVDNLLKSKFTLGADVSVAAGPKGRSAEAGTDLRLKAEILTYSRSRGLFAGVSLEGAVVKQDKDANRELYGRSVDPREVLKEHHLKVPAAARALVEALESASPGRAQ